MNNKIHAIMKTIILKCELEGTKCPIMQAEFERIEEACKAFEEVKKVLKDIPHFIGIYKRYLDTYTNTHREILIDFQC